MTKSSLLFRQPLTDRNGWPLASGLVYLFEPYTEPPCPRSGFLDPACTIVATHPVILDAQGFERIHATITPCWRGISRGCVRFRVSLIADASNPLIPTVHADLPQDDSTRVLPHMLVPLQYESARLHSDVAP